ncbi:hypothetical protein [Rickettsia endosymbiont of Ceutorhynchus obstrictus]|uniref:hypothetical protein n=1 Tax=Rickettsia endosymbiont of Ceutorhynchus obstrictus TaxID=3066249 RepID=UPI003133149E
MRQNLIERINMIKYLYNIIFFCLILMPRSVAAGISTMISYATISDDFSQGWQNGFNDGDTVEVDTAGVSPLILAAATVNVQAIRLNQSLPFLGNDSMNGTKSNVINIGSIYGVGNSVQIIYAGGSMSDAGQVWTLNGNAGEDDNPIQNNYSGIQLIHFIGKSTFNLEAPITLDSEFQIASEELNVTMNINDDITIVHPSITSIGSNGIFNIAAGKALTLSGSDMNLTSPFNFSDSGILTLSGDNTIFNPSLVSNVNNAVLNINNDVQTNMPSVLTINTINIANGKSFTIDAVNGDIDLLDNNASINFGDSGAVLVLTNSGTSDRIFTAYNTLAGNVLFSSDGSLVADNGIAGKVTTATTNTGTLTVVAGNVTGAIGTNGGNILKQVLFNGVSNITSVDATTLTINNAGADITATGVITAAVNYAAVGTLTADNGITGNVDFAGNDGVLQLADAQTITGNVDSTNASAGTLEFLGTGTVTGTIGATNALTALKFSGAGAITIPAANVTTYEVANADAVVTASSLLTGNVLFSSDGSLVASKGITGNVDFAGNDGVLQLADAQTITGNVDSSTAVAGTLEFLGTGTVTGTIGATNALTALKFSGAGAITIPAANVTTYEVANADAVVTASSLLTGNVLFSSDGSLVASKGITGNVDFAGNDGVLQLADAQTITGNVDSSTAVAGTLEFLVAGTVTGTIGATKALTALKFSGAGAITIPAANVATYEVANAGAVVTASSLLTGNVLFSSDGSLVASKGITGNVDFAGNDGVLQLADAQTITGNVDSSTAVAGTLEFLGAGTVTGTIGATKALTALKFSGAGAITIPAANVATYEVANAGAVVTASSLLTGNVLFSSDGSLVASKGITGNVDFAGNDGVLQLADAQTITGNVDSSTAVAGTLEFLGAGTVTGTIGATKALTALKFSGAGAITIPAANVATYEVANAGAVVTASSLLTGNVLFSSDGSLVASKGITGNVDFAGNDGVLQLADAQTITGNVDSSTAVAGTLEFLGAGTVTGTIGATKALTALKFSGAGAITIPAANVATYEVANAGAVVTASSLLTGNVLFSSDGSLVASKGITGNVDFAGNDGVLQLADAQTITGNVDSSTAVAGTLEFLGAGTVTGTIGATKALTALKFSGAGAITIPAANVTTYEVANAGAVVTASSLLTGNVLFSSDGSLVASKGITGNVDFAGNDGVLQLADAQTITGNVDSSTAVAGTLEFLGAGTVTGTIGATKALTALKFSGAGAITIPAANVATYEVANAGAVVTASGLLTGNVLFSSDGSLVASKGITGNVDFVGNDGVLQLADAQTITGNVDSSTAVAGTLEFLGAGTVTGTIGATKALTALKFSGAGAITIPAASATTYEVANAGAVVTASGLLTGDVLFSSDGSLVADKGVDGSITTATDNTGTIKIGSGDVGVIGASDKKLKQVNLNQATAASIGKLYAANVSIGGLGPITATDLITAAVSFSSDGTLIASNGITGDIDFAGNAASLIFNGNSGDNWYTLGGTISNASSALLEVDAKLRVTDKGIGEIKTINIGENGILSIESNEANLSLISTANGSINFTDNNAQLILSAPQDQTINFVSSIAGSNNGGGEILLDGNGYNLTITLSNNASLGTDAHKLGAIDISGNVIFEASVDANVLNLNINDGAYLTDYSAASASIDSINIGNSEGAGQYILDARDEDFSMNADNIIYRNEDSVLALVNTSEDEDRTITLDTSIVPSQDKYGVLTLYSKGDKKLTIDNNGDETVTIGTAEHRLKQLTLSSDGDAEFDIRPEIQVESIGLDLSKIDLGVVDANIIFHNSTQYNANGDINGSIDFQGNDGIINVADNVNISGSISSTDAASGTLNFLGSSTIGEVVSNISTMKAGAGYVTFLASGDYSIEELQGSGSGIITFPSSVNFTGGINITGGDPLNLSFAGSTNIDGNIGSTSSPVGDISSSNNIKFNGDINSSGDISTSGETLFAGNVTCNNIIANKTSSNTLSFITLTSAFTASSSSNTINFDQDNAVTQFQGAVNTTGNIEVNGSTYFADTVNSQGNVVINGNTKFNKTLSSSNNIAISSGSNVIFNGDVSASSINIDNANIEVVDNISMQGNISANNSTIILDTNTLTLSGTSSFSNQLMISSSYDESSLSGGNIILESGSTLDLSNVSELTIKLAFINSDISKINDDTKYNIILAEDGSNIILLSDPENQIVLDSSGEQNKFVRWTLDARSLTLYASDDSNNVIDNDYVFDSEQDNIFMQELKNALPGSLAQEFKNNIGLLSKEQVEEMLSKILDHPKERNSEIICVALQQTLTDTHKVAMNAIHNRLLNTSPTVVAAGDDDINKYGVWARSSINHSKDKVSGSKSEYFSSYKTRGHSNTIGFDGLISDNLLLGIAYTNAYTNIRPQDQNIGNVDKVRTNMFSLYSAYNIPNYDWYVDGTISYAESSIRSGKIRHLAVARNILGSEVASSKYKSYLYSGSVSLGYNYNLNNNIYVTPSLGAIGSLIRDKGYAESGTSFQNLTVHKKNYNKLSGVAGLRTYQDIYLASVDNVIITPEVYGFINYAVKNKTPAIDARLPGIDEPLPTINYRSNRVDYNLGLGITVKHKMMEYGINYDANLAKKYQGHSGSLKVRVNL